MIYLLIILFATLISLLSYFVDKRMRRNLSEETAQKYISNSILCECVINGDSKKYIIKSGDKVMLFKNNKLIIGKLISWYMVNGVLFHKISMDNGIYDIVGDIIPYHNKLHAKLVHLQNNQQDLGSYVRHIKNSLAN